MQGWVFKKAPKGQLTVASWRKRYFVLHRYNQKLFYYEDETCQVEVGCCDLSEVLTAKPVTPSLQQQEELGFHFEIVTIPRIWELYVETDEERTGWLTALSRVVPQNDECKGWMHTLAQRNSSWKKRFCLLYPNGLAYYEDEACNEYISACDFGSAINVLTFKDVPNFPTKFGVEIVCMSPPRVWHFCTDTEEEAQQWAAQISRFVPILADKTMPLRGGFITKQGDRIKTWKSRFFVLVDHILFYFHDVAGWKKLLGDEELRRAGCKPRDFVSDAPTGVIPLRGTEIVLNEQSNECSFAIKTPKRL